MKDRYQILTLDVWGNEINGYEINNFFNWKIIDADELADEKAFLTEYLIGDPDQYEIDSCSTESFFEVRHKETGKPILHLQKIYEGE